jgi:hypothetical protein
MRSKSWLIGIFFVLANGPLAASEVFRATLGGANALPANSSQATGTATVTLDADAGLVTISMGFSGLTQAYTSVHLHGPAETTTTGPQLITIAMAGSGGYDGGTPGSTAAQFNNRELEVNATQIADLRAGRWYADVHNARYPGGEIRGQLRAAALGAGYSGNWFDAQQDGHGFQIEVLPNNVITVFWFTFDGDGKPLWLAGVGQIVGNTATVDLARETGGRFPPNFDASAIQRRLWGTLQLTFSDCNHGTVTWTTSEPGFTGGSMNLERVTQLGGTTCP